MRKVLVIGGNGMAGHVVADYFREAGDLQVWTIARNTIENEFRINLDVTDTGKLKEILQNGRFDNVINCIGILNKHAEDNPHEAIWYNSYFPHFLAHYGETLHFKLITISTDCVFSGSIGGYSENSAKDGIGFYSQSKALGEVNYGNNLTIRTSIIGPELNVNGIGLFHWFMKQADNTNIKGYKNAFWTGVTTLVLAKAIYAAIDQDLKGLYHLVNRSKISKFDLLQIINSQFKDNRIHIHGDEDYKVDKSLINSRSDFDFDIPSYPEMIEEMKTWILARKKQEFYSHYFTND